MKRYYLAIDIGASSGRHILGYMENGTLQTREVWRFENGASLQDGHLIWDTDHLVQEVKAGITEARRVCPGLSGVAIDTWAVDYVLLKGSTPVLPCYAYRDGRTQSAVEAVHQLIPFPELYSHTGCQFQTFNTIYQLYADKLAGRLEGVTDFLMLPEYLTWQLTGVKLHEYTNAKSTGLVNAVTDTWDLAIIDRLGLPRQLFGALSAPGTPAGFYEGIPVWLCASHDTASAVEGIPMEGNQPYISSGTWSLLGIKTEKPLTDAGSMAANYSNEGGIGYNRYQKNIMGMWLINRLKEELCPEMPFGALLREAENSTYPEILDANDPSLMAPESMCAAFDALLPAKPAAPGDYIRCACRSLAESYRRALAELESNTGLSFDRLYIVGGGAKNQLLNRLTEAATGKKVIAIPIESTAIGNLMVQIRTSEEEN